MSELVQSEPEETSASREPAYMTNEELLARVEGAFQKIADAVPCIVELRARFARQKRGSVSICGCHSWEEFCTKRLHRSPRRIRQVLAAADAPKDTGVETKPKPDSRAALDAAMQELEITSDELAIAAAKYEIPVKWILRRLSRNGWCWNPVKEAYAYEPSDPTERCKQKHPAAWAFDEQAVLVRLFRDWELGIEKKWPKNRDLTPVIRKVYAFAKYLEGLQKVRVAELREQVQAVGIVQVSAR